MGILQWARHTELMRKAYEWALVEIRRQREAGHAALVGT
jgi:hypothetical protein